MKVIILIIKVIVLVIALAFTILISQIIPKNQFEPWSIELNSLRQKQAGTREYVVDLNNDSLTETIIHRNINKASSTLEYIQNGHLQVFAKFAKEEVVISNNFHFADINHDSISELIFLSVIQDSVYLHIIGFDFHPQNAYLIARINVEYVRYSSANLPDVTNSTLITNQSNIFFNLNAGYSIQPRHLYKYDFENKTLRKTPQSSITTTGLDYLNFDQQSYVLSKSNQATGNTINPKTFERFKNTKQKDSLEFYHHIKNSDIVYQYGDFASYILLYDDRLNYAFEPPVFIGWTNYTKSEFVKIDGIPHIVSLTNTLQGDTLVRMITICSLKGEVIKKMALTLDYTQIFTEKDKIVLVGKDFFHVYSNQLELLKEVLEITYCSGFYDINQDFEKEFIAFRHNEMVVLSQDFDINATFPISQEFAPYPEENRISLLQIGDRHSFTFNTRLFYYLFSYNKNSLAIFKYPFYLLIFSLWTGLLFLIIRLNSRRLEKEKQHLEKIVSDRTTELQVKNGELVLKNEKIQAQAEMITVQYERLEEIDQFKETLTHALVHDLKNPLSQVLVNTSNENVRTAASKMLRLIMNMLDVEKYEKAGLILTKEILSLRNIITEVIKSQEISLIEKNLEVHLHFIDFKIVADKEVMTRIFDNLLSNAVRYSPLNRSIDIYAEPLGDNLLEISMKNYGDPISMDAMPFIFDKFRHFGKTESGTLRSTGLGLTFCKMAIEAHGGKIGAHNNPDEGCSFWFTMHAVSQDVKQEENETILPDLKPKLILSETEKEDLKEVVNKIKEFRIFEISRFHEILDPLKDTSEVAVNEWISRLFYAINIQNVDEYNRLLTLEEDEQT